MEKFHGKGAVVTGAGSGMGRELAIQLTKAGARVAISDVDEAGLRKTADLCTIAGDTPRADVLDVSNRERVHAYADEVAADFGTVNLVVNNAGIAMFGTVEATPYADIEKVMDIDFWGVVHGSKAFLPHLIASGDGHLVNISSIFGLFSCPTQSSYNAAKFAVRGFTESLRQEMLLAGHPVKVTCVHPGGIKTNIVNRATSSAGDDLGDIQQVFTWLPRTTADDAATVILRGAAKGRARVLVGMDAIALDLIVRVLGSKYQRLFGAAASRILKQLARTPRETVDTAA